MKKFDSSKWITENKYGKLSEDKVEAYYVVYQKDDSGTKELEKFPFTDADSSKKAREDAERYAKIMRNNRPDMDNKITNPVGVFNPKRIPTK
jgi:hypothetical protein